MQTIERGVDENVAAGPRFEGRSETNVAESHRRYAREQGRPRLKRAGNQRMQMIDVDDRAPAITERVRSERAGPEESHHSPLTPRTGDGSAA